MQREGNNFTISQYSLGKIVLMFAWPALWFTLLIYGLAPLFAPEGKPIPTSVFLGVVALGNGAELIVALVLLRREGYSLAPTALRERLMLYWPKGWKRWGLALAAFVVIAALSGLASGINRQVATVIPPPTFWHPMSNPTTEITSAADAIPDINLPGNYFFLIVFAIVTFIFNIVGEELYCRGFLLPKMRGVFGKWAWVANGVFSGLTHIYQPFLLPSAFVGGLGFAFCASVLGSLPLAMLVHWLGNFFIALLLLAAAVFGLA